MIPERWVQIENLFHSALQCEPEERSAYLCEACVGDVDLHRQVEALLSHESDAERFIDFAVQGALESLGIQDLPRSSEDFRGTERFLIQRRLGAGGFGTVYQAYDRKHNAVVALKTLHYPNPGALFRFKSEFRALTDIVHPNLVALYELMSEAGQWFFTMELIHGTNFMKFVVDLTHLESALTQLVEAVHTLHEAGKLHRDIKPSNVLVTNESRVVLLDFGLVTDIHSEASSTPIVGTPAYMSPEQGIGKPLSKASDWYSVGVMLYQALTGRLPFAGPLTEVIANKQKFDPEMASELVPGIPDGLNLLCRDLLRRNPSTRPKGQEILCRLAEINRRAHDDSTAILPGSVASSSPARQAPFIGRQREVAALKQAFQTATEGHPIIVHVHGGSGIGKSTLVHHFLDELQKRQRALVLAGRCYERESIPYKAVDNLLDGVTQYLEGLSPHEVRSLLPDDLSALTRLFPVLGRVKILERVQPRQLDISDPPQEVRRRGFAALSIRPAIE